MKSLESSQSAKRRFTKRHAKMESKKASVSLAKTKKNDVRDASP